MMIDVLNEEVIDLRRACRESVFRNARTGNAAHISSLYRLVTHGARDVAGQRVQLETIKTPSGLRTSREAIERFVMRLTQPDAAPKATTPSQRRRSIANAKAELDRAGVKPTANNPR